MSYFEETDKEMDRYLEDHASTEPAILKKLRKETYQKTTQPHMISGYLQGRLLSILSHIIQPKNVLEIGTFTGYAALSIAEGLPKDGKIFTIDKNEDLAYIPKKYFLESDYKDQIELIIGNAKEEIKKLDKIWDLIFIDADKESYLEYLTLIKPNLRSGSIILIDNVLWYGKVLDQNTKNHQTQQIQLVNKIIAQDPEFENLILPLRDGINLIRKI